MPRQPESHRDDFDIVYMLREHGWSDLVIIDGARLWTICTSHVFSCPMTELMNLASLVIDGEDGCVKLHDEPGVTFLRVAFDPCQKHLIESPLSRPW